MMVYPRALVARHIYARTVAAWPSAEPTDKPPGRYPPIRCPRPPRDARELAPIPAGPARRTRTAEPGPTLSARRTRRQPCHGTGRTRVGAPARYPRVPPNRVATARGIPGRYPTARADASPTYPRGPTAQPGGNRRTGPTAVPLAYRATARGPTIPATVPYPRADTGYNQTGPTLTQPRGPLPAPIPRRPPDPRRTRADHRTQVCYNPRQQTRNPPSNTHSNPKTESNTCSNRTNVRKPNVKT